MACCMSYILIPRDHFFGLYVERLGTVSSHSNFCIQVFPFPLSCVIRYFSGFAIKIVFFFGVIPHTHAKDLV